MRKTSPKDEIKRLGYKLVYVPHKVVTDHVAVYNVIYKGKHFMAPNREQQKKRNEKLEMPLNQIWISKKYRKYEGVILFHELQEIKYQRRGYSIRTAHKMARKDEKKFTTD
jgi:competence protein ComEA